MSIATNTRAVLAESRRGLILRTLHDQPDYALNDGVIQDALVRFGEATSRDVVRGDLAWLEEQGLVSTKDLANGRVIVATLTIRGEDVATGRAQNPGVKRPDPRG